jgi:hypothetical protein
MDATYRIQANSGTVSSSATCTPTLPNPTTDGSTLFMFISNSGTGALSTSPLYNSDPPWVPDAAHSTVWQWWRRDNETGGETSWPLSTTGSIAANWIWRVEEWAGLSTVSQPDATSSNPGTNTPSIDVGLQVNPAAGSTGAGSPASPDVPDFAGIGVFRTNAGSAAWPAAHTWTAGWSEIDYQHIGDGSTTGNMAMFIVESYPGVTGSLPCALTWDNSGGGTYTDKQVDAWVGCYQPADPGPALGILAS